MNRMKLNIQLFASGTIGSSTNTSSGGDVRIVWSSTKNDTNNNSSVTATVQARRTTAGSTYCTLAGTVTIDGTAKSISRYRPSSDPWNSNWKDVGTYTKTVTHNEDGSKQIKVSCNVNGDAGSMDGNFKASATVTLDKINRTSLLGEIDDFNIDDTISIVITKYISTATDTLVIKAGETTIKTVSGLSDGYNLTFTTAEKNAIKAKMTSPRIALNFTLTSVDGSTTLGTSIKSAVCIYLDMPTLFRIKKTTNGNYRLAINGPCDESGEILQIYDDDGNLSLIYYKPGDTYKINNYVTVCGTLTASKGQIRFGIFVPKLLTNVSYTITINKAFLTIRNSSGSYIIENSDVATSMAAFKGGDNAIYLKYSKSSMLGTNNTPVSVEINDLELTFN